VVLHFLSSKLSPLTREFMVACIIFVAVVASRHITLDHPVELSGDESELLVQVERYERDLMPWRSVDGSTIGPVNPWFLLVLKQVGWPMNYSAIHFLGALLLGAITVVSYFAVRLFLPFVGAALVGLAGTIAVGLSSSINFMYYATELFPALALGVAVLGLVWARQKGRGAPLALMLASLVAGLAPWAKLQAAPVALLICVFIAWAAWVDSARERAWRVRFWLVGFVALAALLPTVVIVWAVYAGGIFPDFWASYIVANLGYAGEFTWAKAGLRLGRLLYWSQLNGLMAGVAALAVHYLFTSRRSASVADDPARWLRAFAIVYLGTTLYCCIRPPHGFGHYHIFLIGPLFLAAGLWIRRLTRLERSDASITWLPDRSVIVALLVPVCLISGYNHVAGASLRLHLNGMRDNADRDLPAVVCREINRLAPEASTMVVWGWMPTLYVRSGLFSATRHTISHFLIDPGPSRDLLREQFLREVLAAEPDVIVDAVASDCFVWNWDVPSSGIESFPEFAAYVKANYALVLNVIGDEEGVPLRVFVRPSCLAVQR